MSHRLSEPVVVVDYDPAWPAEFERLRQRAADLLGALALRIEHVGSTAVPGLATKPVIDLYVLIASRADFLTAIERLVAAGYLAEGELGVPGREGFAWPPGERRHHLYLAVEADPRVGELIAFRDHLRSHPDDAAAYAELKRELAERHGDDREAYADGKTVFVSEVLARTRA